MKKDILNIGKSISKSEQKEIMGGRRGCCDPADDCCVPNDYWPGWGCRFLPGNPNTVPPYCI